eukprot:6647277-Prymnesium_polylepis.2
MKGAEAGTPTTTSECSHAGEWDAFHSSSTAPHSPDMMYSDSHRLRIACPRLALECTPYVYSVV